MREAYEDETKRGGPVRRPVSPRKNVEKYVSGVRDAFIRPETKRPSTAPEGRARRVTSKPTTETKPFAGLEARATIQRKSTSFRKMEEDLRKKREAEEANLRYRFKPVPIPKSTREKRYQALVDKAEAIRIEGTAARKERLGDMIKPFEGMEMRDQERLEKKKRREEERKAAARRKKEDDDEAKRIQKIKKQRAAAAAMRAAEEHRAQEVLRRARMAKRAEDQLRHSKAPSRMAEFEKVKGQKAMEKARRAELKRAADERRRKAKSKVLGPGDIRASFEKKHARLKRRMQQGRMTKAPTRSKPFAFMSEDRMREEQERRKMHAQKLQQEEMEKREAARAPIVRMKMLAERSKKIRQPIPGQTKKSAAQEKLVKERLARRREEEEERKRDLKARQDKIKNASKEMQVVLRRRIEEEESRKGPTEDPRQRAANAKKDMEARLKRLRESIDKAVANRRYLFDQHKLDKRKQLARRKALETVGAAVFSSTDGDEDRDWKDAARKDKSGLFKDEEKEEMEIYDDDDDDYAKDDDFED